MRSHHNIPVGHDVAYRLHAVRGDLDALVGVSVAPARDKESWAWILVVQAGHGPQAAVRRILARVGLRIAHRVWEWEVYCECCGPEEARGGLQVVQIEDGEG